MSKPNLNSQAKRKRELAKKDKRDAKDQKRAIRKEEARNAKAVTAGIPVAAPALTLQQRADLAMAQAASRLKP